MKDKQSQFLRIWSEIRWLLLGSIWTLSLFLGYLGFSRYASDNSFTYSITERIYRSLQLISMNSGAVDGINNWMLDLARFTLPALTAFTLLQAIIHLFREQMQWLQLWGLDQHIIICGLGRKGSHLIDELLHHKKRLLVIQNGIDKITANVYRKQGVLVLNGDPCDSDILKSGRITKASHLVCLLGDDQKNLNIAHKAYNLVKIINGHKLTCIVHLGSQHLLNLVKKSELSLRADDPFILETFNIYEQISHQLIHNDPVWRENSPNPPSNLLIIGFGRLGQNLCRQAAYTWYRRKYQEKLNITIIDQEAPSKIDQFMDGLPKFKTVCNLIPIQTDLGASQKLQEIIEARLEQRTINRAYVCLGNPVLSLQVGLSIQEIPAFRNVPIHLRLEKESGLMGILENPLPGFEKDNNIKPFDLYESTFSSAMVLGGIHEMMAIKLRENYLQNLNVMEYEEQLEIPWEEVSEAEKDANRQQANRIHQLLQCCGYSITTLENWDAGDFTFTEQEISQMARKEHELWCHWKKTNGWQFGETRNDLQKTNPDLVPWESLPEVERLKNKKFIREIPGLLADIGFQIDRIE